jgi:lipopolysaccharide biosynthesis regulator YciM
MDALSELQALRRERRFSEALELVERLLKEAPFSTELLVRHAELLQLAPQAKVSNPLAAAEASLAQALALAPDAIEPRIEMGHLLYAVQDRPADGLDQFEAAEELARAALRDALIGKIKCLAQLGQHAEAGVELASAAQIFPADTDLGVLQAELEGEDDEGT